MRSAREIVLVIVMMVSSSNECFDGGVGSNRVIRESKCWEILNHNWLKFDDLQQYYKFGNFQLKLRKIILKQLNDSEIG